MQRPEYPSLQLGSDPFDGLAQDGPKEFLEPPGTVELPPGGSASASMARAADRRSVRSSGFLSTAYLTPRIASVRSLSSHAGPGSTTVS